MTSNIIQFPFERMLAPPQTLEEVKDNIERVRIELAIESTQRGMIALLETLADEGIDLTGDDNIKDNALIAEAIKAAIYKSLTLSHGFHAMVEEMFEFQYLDEEMCSYTYKLPLGFATEEESNS